MKTILVPTDFSPIAANALSYDAALASQVKGKIILVHAIEFQAFADVWGQIEMKPDERLETYYYDKLNKLSGQLRLENSFRFTVETLCVHGVLAPQVKALVKDKNIDLVIMGTKGTDTFGQMFFGTQTATCMREAICPVLAIPALAHYCELKTVVYVADFECTEERALAQLSRFTQTFGLDITVLNIKSEEQLDMVDDDQVRA